MSYGHGVEITGAIGDRYEEILTPEAVDLVVKLQRELIPRRAELLLRPQHPTGYDGRCGPGNLRDGVQISDGSSDHVLRGQVLRDRPEI